MRKFNEEMSFDDAQKVRRKCECGHSLVMPARNKFVYCSWCKNKVFKNSFYEFEYKLNAKMGRVNHEQVIN